MTNAGLVVHGIAAPERRELAKEIGRLVCHLGRPDEVDGICAGPSTNGLHLLGNLADRLLPGNAPPFPAI
jgi:hypothetical protein